MNKSRGFSLIELMIVVAIVAIIASIAYPSYRENMMKTRRADAKAAVMDLAARMERNYTQFGSYTATATTSPQGYYNVTATVTNPNSQTFTITANAPAGSPQNGDNCGNYMINQAQQKTVSGTLASNICW